VEAETMQRLGVVNRVVATDQLAAETEKLARRLAAGPAQAYAETKALANRAMHAGLAAHLDAEALAFARCAKTEDFVEGVTAFTEKRKPRFKNK
jgi:2-(1,2-epoxy-1,2-dihydrophenyl)acetyl-CoA isomerase